PHCETPEVVVALAYVALVALEGARRDVARVQSLVDRLGRLETALHGQHHAGREDGIEERRRVADGEPPIPGHLPRQIAIVGVEARGGTAPRALEQRRSGRRGGEIVGQALLRRGARFAPMRYLGDDGADADDGLREWDEPEPAHIQPREHADVPGAPASGPGNALVLRVDGDVTQERVVLVAAEALGQHAGAARRVDDNARPQRGLAAGPAAETPRDPIFHL